MKNSVLNKAEGNNYFQ